MRGSFGSTPLENVLSLPSSVRELLIEDSVPVSVIYAALQKLGSRLTELEFEVDNNFSPPDIRTPIDVYKVLAACPKLESFDFLYGKPVLTRNKSEFALLRADYFQNFKRLFGLLAHSENYALII